MKKSTLEVLTGASIPEGDAPAAERPGWLDEVLEADGDLQNAWRGLGKNVAECDRETAVRLLAAGHAEAQVLDALRWRPIRYFLPDGDPQLVRQMASLLRMVREEQARRSRAVQLLRMVIYDGDPPLYRAFIASRSGEREVTLTSAELISSALFRKRVMELCHELVDVPKKQFEWDAMVRDWLEMAEHVAVDHTARQFTMAEVETIVADWPVIDAADAHESDLRRGVIVDDEDAGIQIVHLAPIRREMHAQNLECGPNELAMLLREIGWEASRPRVGGKQVRAWTRKRPAETRDSARDTTNTQALTA